MTNGHHTNFVIIYNGKVFTALWSTSKPTRNSKFHPDPLPVVARICDAPLLVSCYQEMALFWMFFIYSTVMWYIWLYKDDKSLIVSFQHHWCLDKRNSKHICVFFRLGTVKKHRHGKRDTLLQFTQRLYNVFQGIVVKIRYLLTLWKGRVYFVNLISDKRASCISKYRFCTAIPRGIADTFPGMA